MTRGPICRCILLIILPLQTLGQTWPLRSLMLTLFPFYYLSLGNEGRAAYISLSYLSFPGDIAQEQLAANYMIVILGHCPP